MKKVLEQIKTTITDNTVWVAVANACDKAYNEGIGKLKDHVPIGTGPKDQLRLAQNCAGLQAILTGIGVIANHRGYTTREEVDAQALKILNDIATDNLSGAEKLMMYQIANAVWGAGQPFRTDKGVFGRETNVFYLLPDNEINKDAVQIKTAAAQLLEKLQ